MSLDHVIVIAEYSWQFLRGTISYNCILLEKKETVTVIQIDLRDLWKLQLQSSQSFETVILCV